MKEVRPFSEPWQLVELREGFEIQDAARRALAIVYFRDEQAGRLFARRLLKDDARRMAKAIMRLPELLRTVFQD